MRNNYHTKNEIIYQIKTDTTLTSDINLELLLKCVESDVVFYLPDPNIFLEYLKNYSSIIIEKYKKINTIYVVVEDNFDKKSEVYKTISLANIKIVKPEDLDYPDNNSIVIFDDLKNISNFNEFIKLKELELSQYIHIFGFTTSPFFFYDLYTSTDAKYSVYTPLIYGHNLRWYYKRSFENTEIVLYKKIEEELYISKAGEINKDIVELSKIINRLKASTNESEKYLGNRMMFLLCNGLFKTNFVIEVLLKEEIFLSLKKEIVILQFTSNKLSKLINEIMNTEANNIIMLFGSSDVLDVVFSILKYEMTNTSCGNNFKSSDDTKKMEIQLRTELKKKIHLLNYNELKEDDLADLIICYDYKPIHNKSKKIIFNSESKKDLYENLKTFEGKIENEIRKTLKVPDILNKKNMKIDFHKNYKLKIHSNNNVDYKRLNNENLFQVNTIDVRRNIIYIDKQHNYSFVGFKVQKSLDEAVEFEFIKPNCDTISLSVDGFELGNVVDYKTFVNGHKIICPTFVYFKRDVIVFYCFNKEMNLKIKISVSCMEEYIFVEKNEFILNFYLCLNRKPKIYMAQNVGIIMRKWSSIYNMKSKDRYDLCENVIWNRCSIEDIPFVKNKDDIKVSINLKNNPDFSKIKDIIVRNRIRSKDMNYNKSKDMNYNKSKETNYNKSKDMNYNSNKFKEDLENRKVKLYDVIDCVISLFTRFSKIKILFSNFNTNTTSGLSTKQIYDYFSNRSFEDFFYIMCLVSQKERYIAYNIREEDCHIISNSNIYCMVNYLLGSINKRFQNVVEKIRSFKESTNDIQTKKIRQVIVTPLTIIYKMPVSFESNRILREFDYEKFLRVSLREEDLKTKIRDTANKDQNCIYNYYRNILNDGLFMGSRKYFFVAMTTSQMKLHNAWFLTPYFSNNILIGPDYIRNWLGDFSEIKNIGKYAMRLGQALSSTIPTVDIDKFIEIEDNIKNSFNFSDGVGVISFTYAMILAEKLGLEIVPSAFQIRFGGYKGVIVAHPINEEDMKFFNNFNIDDQIGQGVLNLLLSDRNLVCKRKKFEGNDNNEPGIEFGDENKLILGLGNVKESDIVLVLRKSMRKFNSKHRNMECITHSSCNPCYLNRQIINLLEGLGISISIFLEHQDKYVIKILSEVHANPIQYIRKFFGGLPLKTNVKDLKIFKKLLVQISNKIVRDLYKKNKILIENGAVLMGTLDELMVLKENEVFIKVRKDVVGRYDNFIVDGEYFIVIGPAIILKNPCLHPGDVRLVYGVNRPELSFMRDVLVFNQVGDRPIPNMCSGSDLDGDMYTVIWEKSLIPKYFHEPSLYEDQTFLSKEIVCLKDIVNFYIRYIRNYHLGSIAHAHMVYCDLHDVKSENAKLLAELFNKSIDFPRTGFIASVPESLIPLNYPDFIQISGNIYPSFKSLGILFRRSYSTVMNTNLKCECKECLKRYISGLHVIQRIVFQGSSIKYKSINNCQKYNEYDSNEWKLETNTFENFKRELYLMMNKYGFKKEDDILLQFYPENDESFYENVMSDCKKLFNKQKSEIKNKKLNLDFLLQKSEDCTENINSLPLAFVDHEEYRFMYRNLYDRTNISNNSGFIYNFKFFINEVRIIDGKEEFLNDDDSINFDYKENIGSNERKSGKVVVKNDKIHAFTDTLIYRKFMNNINRDFDDLFSEIFNLLFLIEFFDSKSFDLVFVFFLFLQSKVKSNDKLEISKILYRISREFYANPTNETLIFFIHKEMCKSNSTFYLINYKENMRSVEVHNQYSLNNEDIKLLIDKIARSLSTVAYLLIFDLNLVQKYISIKENNEENYKKNSASQNYKKKGGYGDIILKGMFDTSDELKLERYLGIKHTIHKDIDVFTPKLMNKGFCEMETHKINVKEFFINSYFNCLYSKIQKIDKQKQEFNKHLITITVVPGKFYIYDVPNNYINEILTIENLSSSLQFYKRMYNEDNKTYLKGYFFNTNELIDQETREDYMKKKNIIFKNTTTLYTFSMVFNNARYQIYYNLVDDKFIIKYITKGRCVAGKVFVINDGDKKIKDVSFEIMYEEIILKDEFTNMSNDESKIFSTDLISIKNEEYLVSKTLNNCRNFRFEIDVKLSVDGENSLELINRRIYTGSRDIFTLECFHKRLVVSSTTTNNGRDVSDVSQFMKLFEKSWENFVKYYS